MQKYLFTTPSPLPFPPLGVINRWDSFTFLQKIRAGGKPDGYIVLRHFSGFKWWKLSLSTSNFISHLKPNAVQISSWLLRNSKPCVFCCLYNFSIKLSLSLSLNTCTLTVKIKSSLNYKSVAEKHYLLNSKILCGKDLYLYSTPLKFPKDSNLVPLVHYQGALPLNNTSMAHCIKAVNLLIRTSHIFNFKY